LRYFGTRRIAAAIRHDLALAEYLAQRLAEAADFELLAPVELSICCFRYVPAHLREKLTRTTAKKKRSVEAEIDQLNTRLMLAVQRGGSAYLSSATINGKFALRACITNFRTTRANIDETLEVVREAASELS